MLYWEGLSLVVLGNPEVIHKGQRIEGRKGNRLTYIGCWDSQIKSPADVHPKIQLPRTQCSSWGCRISPWFTKAYQKALRVYPRCTIRARKQARSSDLTKNHKFSYFAVFRLTSVGVLHKCSLGLPCVVTLSSNHPIDTGPHPQMKEYCVLGKQWAIQRRSIQKSLKTIYKANLSAIRNTDDWTRPTQMGALE